jgi:hypothetical protein
MSVLNSTDTTMAGVRIARNMPQVYEGRDALDPISASIESSGALRARPGHPAPSGPPVVAEDALVPGGSASAELLYRVDSAGGLMLTWMLGPERNFSFELR